jgi:hypothetical protein
MQSTVGVKMFSPVSGAVCLVPQRTQNASNITHN